MLSLLSSSSPRDQKNLLASFDPAVATWVVSDLKSKLDLSRALLTTREFIPGESVLRASELWKLLLTRLRPDLQVISREFAITLIAQKLSGLELEWTRSPGAAQTAYDYLSQLMPVLAHPNGEEMVREWFRGNPASETRWARWFDLSLDLWKGFLAEGFVAPKWVSGVLVNESDLTTVWTRPLIVDLGAELNQVEADLLVLLSEATDVSIIRPEPAWREEYSKALVAYEIFERKLKVRRVPLVSTPALAFAPEPGPGPAPQYRKYTTMIAEVKDAIAQVRTWLEGREGPAVEPSKIAIVAPDIESYWPALSCYLDQEGVPCQKDRVRRLHSYPDIARWLSSLRLRAGFHAEADLELGLFDPLGRAPRLISHERFRTLYSTVYGREDLARSENVASCFAVEVEVDGEEIGRDDFVAWTMKRLPEEFEGQRVESLYHRLFAECPRMTRLSLRRWLAYFEELAARLECRIEDGNPDGIACINLSSAENSPATHMIVLGLTESALRQSGGTAVLFSDVWSLAQEFGFHLASEDQAKMEFEARWVTEGSDRTLVLMVPETDFAGSVQAASWLWVRGATRAAGEDTLTIPEETRWDQIQHSGTWTDLAPIAIERGWSAVHRDGLARSLREDLGEEPPRPFARGAIHTLSPSGLEDYLECPFIFAAKRLFGLTDVAGLDLEIDASRRGSLMHKLLELLTKEPMRFDFSERELDALVEQARELSGLELADARLWAPLKARQLDLARRFLAFERDERARFPETRTIGREFEIAGYLRPSTGELRREGSPGDLKFVGRIDRVDEDLRGHLVIMDYKSSASTVSQWGSWLTKNRIQLLLYSMAIEKGLTALAPRPVLAALYYVMRPLHRDAGFKVEGVEQGLYEIPDRRKKNRISPEDKERLFTEAQALVRGAVERILAGDFAPKPRDPKKCGDCQWSASCRAPHLNS